MQFKYLWAALFLLPLLAHADVTLYGTLDETIESVGTRGAANGQPGSSVRRISSDSSLLGFKGREELGNGLSAYWQVESNLWLDSAPSYATFGTRDSFVGLATPVGSVQAGLISPPTRVVPACWMSIRAIPASACPARCWASWAISCPLTAC
ncbi:porin [Aquitalea magnusonii]|uniref:porin n=1 Tax=Aquitalea magnusonii TaxID=332411 RepID=UPI000A4A244E|nr:porin [Aquitalea magnusonii]